MALVSLTNHSEGWLVLWLEPLGEDRWLKPGETFRVQSDYLGDDLAFSVDWWARREDQMAGIENVSVWVEGGSAYAEITDDAGKVVACGHQRPDTIDRSWKLAMLEARSRSNRS